MRVYGTCCNLAEAGKNISKNIFVGLDAKCPSVSRGDPNEHGKSRLISLARTVELLHRFGGEKSSSGAELQSLAVLFSKAIYSSKERTQQKTNLSEGRILYAVYQFLRVNTGETSTWLVSPHSSAIRNKNSAPYGVFTQHHVYCSSWSTPWGTWLA